MTTAARAVRTILIVLVTLFLVGATLLVGLFVYWSAKFEGPSQGELEVVAQGPQAARDRADAVGAADEEFAGLREALRWLDWQGMAVDQLCDVRHYGMFSSSAQSVECSTDVTGYAGFSGTLVKGLRRFDTGVIKAGWLGDGVYEQTEYYQRYRGEKQGKRVFDASNLPAADYHGDNRHTTRCKDRPVNWSMSLRWLEAGQPLDPHERLRPEHLHTGDAPLYEQKDPLDHLAVKTSLLKKHRYVAVVTLSVTCTYDVE